MLHYIVSGLRYPVLDIYICEEKAPFGRAVRPPLPSDVEDYLVSHITATVHRKAQTSAQRRRTRMVK
ncbi:hypothetical protein F2P81_004500 [Scophthalmus maximus]|uniref:Uncharacterized protein n=1 Tax=Scophthalmus maximus TaxID=52904 RepID=A0A6A4TAZ9_SCOMX|nr:hypothetical protein F2P81_004500 [Scophthalmus maximus]